MENDKKGGVWKDRPSATFEYAAYSELAVFQYFSAPFAATPRAMPRCKVSNASVYAPVELPDELAFLLELNGDFVDSAGIQARQPKVFQVY